MFSNCLSFNIILVAAVSLLASNDAFILQIQKDNSRFPRGLKIEPTQREQDSKRNFVKLNAFSSAGLWNNGLSFGKGPFRFYKNFEDWMSPFPNEDREAYPELFNIPEGAYEVQMSKSQPLGIVFEEIEPGKGVYVSDLVEGGQADKEGIVDPGDVLLAVTAVKVAGAKWERRLIPALKMDFDTVVGAIGSNDMKWGCTDVVLLFRRFQQGDNEKIQSFLDFFEPPFDSMWKQQQ